MRKLIGTPSVVPKKLLNGFRLKFPAVFQSTGPCARNEVLATMAKAPKNIAFFIVVDHCAHRCLPVKMNRTDPLSFLDQTTATYSPSAMSCSPSAMSACPAMERTWESS